MSRRGTPGRRRLRHRRLRRPLRRAGETLAAFAAYALASTWFLRPVWRLGATHLPGGLGDPLLLLYLLTWVGRQVRRGLVDLWQAPFFFPTRDALALSDHMLGPGAQAAAIEALTGGGPVLAYNALFFLSFALSGTTTFAVLRAGGASAGAAFAGGAIFAFSPYRWEQLSHIQVLTAQWIPPLLWTFHRLLARPRPGRAALFLLFYALHVTGGSYLAYLAHVPLAALAAVHLLDRRARRRLLSRRALRVLLPAAALSAALVAAVFLPYLEVGRRYGLTRDAENYRHFGATLVAQATPAPQSRVYPVLRPALRALAPGQTGASWRVEKALFPGVLATLLAAAGAAALWRRRRRRPAPDPGRSRRAALAGLTAGALAVFLAADLLTLGWWPPPRVAALGGLDGAYTALGLLFALLVAARLALGRRWTGRLPLAIPSPSPWERGLLAGAAACWLLAFPVVFEPLSEVVPGLGGMRTPTRTWPFVSFAVAWLAARGLDAARRRIARPRLAAAATAAVALALLAEAAPRPPEWARVPEAPPVYHWIAGQPEVEALLVLPLRRDEREVPAMWFSTVHWRPIVNGFSGYTPPAYERLREVCCWPVPDARALDTLRRMGVTHVLVHPAWRGRWQHEAFAAWRARVAAGEVPGVRQVYRDARGDHVFAIAGAPPAAARR